MRFTFSTSHELPLQRANVAIVIAKFFKKLKCYESCDFIPYLSTDRRETGVSRTIAFPNWSLGTSRVAFTLNSYYISPERHENYFYAVGGVCLLECRKSVEFHRSVDNRSVEC